MAINITPEIVNQVSLACLNKTISLAQLMNAIRQLPCCEFSQLRPGERGGKKCGDTRSSQGLEPIEGYSLPIPNSERTLSSACLECSVFAPALIQLAALLRPTSSSLQNDDKTQRISQPFHISGGNFTDIA